jgi:uncharacterized coiled-coil DUF342 family protein
MSRLTKKHIKTMYNELLSEAESTKALENHIKDLEGEIRKLQDDIKSSKGDTGMMLTLARSKRIFQAFEHVSAGF